jgi:hypothetical protein
MFAMNFEVLYVDYVNKILSSDSKFIKQKSKLACNQKVQTSSLRMAQSCRNM